MLSRICYEWSFQLASSLLPIRGTYVRKLRMNVFFVTILYSRFLPQGLAIFFLGVDTSCTNYNATIRCCLVFCGESQFDDIKTDIVFFKWIYTSVSYKCRGPDPCVTYKILTPYENFKVCGLILGMRTCTPDYRGEKFLFGSPWWYKLKLKWQVLTVNIYLVCLVFLTNKHPILPKNAKKKTAL